MTELYKIDVENKCRDQVKVEISLEPEEDEDSLNCVLPTTSFQNAILSSGISAKPVTALITKIDPSKPLGPLKLSVSAKPKRSAIGGYGGVTNIGGGAGARLDPTYSQAYRDCV